MWDYIMVPFGYIMKFGYDLFDNYAFALFFYALVTKLLLFPLSMKQCQSESLKSLMLFSIFWRASLYSSYSNIINHILYHLYYT